MVELPITMPPKTSHLFYAIPLSIAFTNDSIWNWFYSEFIQMYTFRDFEDCVHIKLYDYGNTDEFEPLENIRIHPYRLKLDNDIINVFKSFIKNGYYINVFGDFFKSKNIKNIRHQYCEMLLYGFSDQKNAFKAFTFNGNKLEEFEIDYENFLEIYYSDYVDQFINTTMLYKLKSEKYELNIEKIKWHLLDYIEGIDTLKRERPLLYNSLDRPQWGINCYDEIINMYNILIEKNRYIGVGETYCVYEHKKDMLNRIIYLDKNSILKCNEEILILFKKVETQSMVVLNMVLRIDQMKRINAIPKIEKLILQVNKLKELEEEAIYKYLTFNKSQLDSI